MRRACAAAAPRRGPPATAPRTRCRARSPCRPPCRLPLRPGDRCAEADRAHGFAGGHPCRGPIGPGVAEDDRRDGSLPCTVNCRCHEKSSLGAGEAKDREQTRANGGGTPHGRAPFSGCIRPCRPPYAYRWSSPGKSLSHGGSGAVRAGPNRPLPGISWCRLRLSTALRMLALEPASSSASPSGRCLGRGGEPT